MSIADSGDHGGTSAVFICLLVDEKKTIYDRIGDHVRGDNMFYSYEEVEVASHE